MTNPTAAVTAAARALSKPPQPKSAAPLSALPPQTMANMAKLWRRMVEIYGHRWTAVHGLSVDADGSSATTWAKGLSGITGQQLAAGLEACIVRADSWPPTLPEFRELCLSIPSLAQVRADLRRIDAERAPFTALVWRHLDGWAYRHADGAKAERLLAEAYATAREAVMRGEPLPEQLLAVEHQAPEPIKPAAPEVARAYLDAMRAELFGATGRAA